MSTTTLTCCVCGEPAGRWQQHWNRDTGWGICPTCAIEQAKREPPERMAERYGQPGVNYQAPVTMTPGHVYRVASTRKGKFTGKLVHQDDTWATFEITSGKADAMLAYNVREKGEEVTVRREWCTFTEVAA